MHSTFALMLLRPREPVGFARQVEEHPQLPAATCERASGYGVVGLPFRSGPRFANGRLAPRTRAEWQTFVANPLRIWLVTSSHAVVHGEELGPIGRFLATSVAVEVPEAAAVAR